MSRTESTAPPEKFVESIGKLRNRNIHPTFEKASLFTILETYVEFFIFIFKCMRKCIFNADNPIQKKNREVKIY